MKLEVGMFLKTKYGFCKISRIVMKGTSNEYYHCNLRENGEDGGVWTSILKQEILKASHNIIDLIEEGDYVNGYPVYEILEYKDNTRAIVIGDDNESIIWEESSHYIKSIVTKEQFEQMQYKVGE